MPFTLKISIAALLALSLRGAAVAQGAHDRGTHDQGKGSGHMHDMGAKPSAGDAPSTAAFTKADAAMMRGMDIPYTGDADIDFRRHMIPHHKGAVDMAKVALAYAKDAETKAMAQAIIDAQEKEIAEMQAWLAKNGKR